MKQAEILCWRKMPNDVPHCASSSVSIVGPQKNALKVAVSIECFGERIGDVVIPSGHGVTIRYASGRTREIDERRISDLRSNMCAESVDIEKAGFSIKA